MAYQATCVKSTETFSQHPDTAPKIFRHIATRKNLAAAKYATNYGFFVVGTGIALTSVTKFAAPRQTK